MFYKIKSNFCIISHSPDDLRKIVDNAVGKIVYPGKVKEKVVEQLKTQITDLERFISFLQGDAQTPGPLGSKCTCPKHGEPTKFTFENHAEVDKTNKKSDSSNSNNVSYFKIKAYFFLKFEHNFIDRI